MGNPVTKQDSMEEQTGETWIIYMAVFPYINQPNIYIYRLSISNGLKIDYPYINQPNIAHFKMAIFP